MISVIPRQPLLFLSDSNPHIQDSVRLIVILGLVSPLFCELDRKLTHAASSSPRSASYTHVRNRRRSPSNKLLYQAGAGSGRTVLLIYVNAKSHNLFLTVVRNRATKASTASVE
uniref:Uncharacterized protein n=1 Tax=uncultured marine virus TaxID=186617 RepID=A0A0F7L972_9VIRU|nr:hypothetical protein [uncultured marine virus]